jgi:hypothetical protein
MGRQISKRKLLGPVRWLTIKEIAELWAQELKIPESIIERELKLGVINITRLRRGQGLINEIPSSKLPKSDTLMTRRDVEEFCAKQSPWPYPQFLFPGRQENARSYPGRPSVMRAIVQHLRDLADANRLEKDLTSQARVLENWIRNELTSRWHDSFQCPTARTIENGIRSAYRWHKASSNQPKVEPTK